MSEEKKVEAAHPSVDQSDASLEQESLEQKLEEMMKENLVIAQMARKVASFILWRDGALRSLNEWLSSGHVALRGENMKLEKAFSEAQARLAESRAAMREEAARIAVDDEWMSPQQFKEKYGVVDVADAIRALPADSSALDARDARLVEALEFYANPETYFAVAFVTDKPCGQFIEDFNETELGLKPGNRARAALAQRSAEKGK